MIASKVCTKCGLDKTEASWGWACRPCRSAASGEWQRKNPERVNAKNAAWRKAHPEREHERREELKTLNAELKSNPCMDCGESFPVVCMDWDHRDPLTKDANVGNLMAGTRERFLTEIAKCDLVCANCHRVRTYIERVAA